MGLRYVLFRAWHMIKRKTGVMTLEYPVRPNRASIVSLDEWRKSDTVFFFDGKDDLVIPRKPRPELKKWIVDFKRGMRTVLGHEFQINGPFEWMTNPLNGYQYPAKHWSKINDFDPAAGDIKYVWESSRFCHVYNIIRYDYHHGENCSAIVFEEIENWIERNPVNTGPNYVCSQEISIRLMNWMFVLYYYRYSQALTEERWKLIANSVYWQLRHVRRNIRWSLIAVRNNHALAETLMLFLGGIFFPFFPEARKWKKDGQRWFQNEVCYQVYADGTYLQHSMNYHRAVIQLLSWAVILAKKNGIDFSSDVHKQAQKSIGFLNACLVSNSEGQLPNYGENDGALFFPLASCNYRDFRPQVNALHYFYTSTDLYGEGPWNEERMWYNIEGSHSRAAFVPRRPSYTFDDGGYYIVKDGAGSMTFIRCAKHHNRPYQCDNLHLDIWYNGINYVRDAGTYRYNCEDRLRVFYRGSQGHNSVMIEGEDQMEIGPRFVWLNWSEAVNASLDETSEGYLFTGAIKAFNHVRPGIIHHRTVLKKHSSPEWLVTDWLEGAEGLHMSQNWNLNPEHESSVSMMAKDSSGELLLADRLPGWYSSKYGQKESSVRLAFGTRQRSITTYIRLS